MIIFWNEQIIIKSVSIPLDDVNKLLVDKTLHITYIFFSEFLCMIIHFDTKLVIKSIKFLVEVFAVTIK